MNAQLQHDLLPTATHDELARQNFVQSLKVHLATRVSPGNKTIYEHRAAPALRVNISARPKTGTKSVAS